MKFPLIRLTTILSLTVLSFFTFAQTKPAAKAKVATKSAAPASKAKATPHAGAHFASTIDSVSYAVGVLVAQNFKSQNVVLNPETVAKGFAAATQGNTLSLSEQECQKIVNNFMMRNQEKQMAEGAKQYLPNKEAGEKFLAENKKKAGVLVTPSGLQYQIIKAGDGPKPTSSDKVKTHYHGTLIDGTVFDSSVDRGEPISFPVSGVIPGWVEALQMMPVGSKWKLYIPQELAYGIRGGGAAIKPYSALIFEVELIAIEK
ncbi:FKBP-type peptidyl-prolyl cis-trans isomerase [Aquirufa nivalisilvae]|uniref:FKBP-type peptidyl-prolyl cis-trans isomerase n=1 Tax=Aquirufa nivalisilvae TaxID=2516557 RepID=UPI0022A91CBC|nr:FKBP-type peptidyl-prolyl cis-trans isomerase [Aquirufa nivalisilvae]MCZ2481053.1 FKBP-type peptidyl-prolyl cis-trans isomerase [Aquirufa nivalisilvae]